MVDQSNKRRVIAMVCPGRFQWYFLHRLAQQETLLGVVVCDTGPTNQSTWVRLRHLLSYLNPFKAARYLASRLLLPEYERETERRLENNHPLFWQLQDRPEGIEMLDVSDINDQRVIDFIAAHKPDVVVVNGTNLVRQPLLGKCLQLPHGIINLHTGLSPYSRGSNCNLYMLLQDQPEFIGATIHYIDQGIDSGDIIRTLRPVLEADDPYEYIEAKVFLAGFEALLASISDLAGGRATGVRQWQKGQLFLQRTGFRYEPFQRLRANRLIRNGLLVAYLADKAARDAPIRLVE